MNYGWRMPTLGVGMYAPFASWKVPAPICVLRMGAYIAPESVATYAPPA